MCERATGQFAATRTERLRLAHRSVLYRHPASRSPAPGHPISVAPATKLRRGEALWFFTEVRRVGLRKPSGILGCGEDGWRCASGIFSQPLPLTPYLPLSCFHVFQIRPLPLRRSRSRCPFNADHQGPRSFAPLGIAGTAQRSIPTPRLLRLSACYSGEPNTERPDGRRL